MTESAFGVDHGDIAKASFRMPGQFRGTVNSFKAGAGMKPPTNPNKPPGKFNGTAFNVGAKTRQTAGAMKPSGQTAAMGAAGAAGVGGAGYAAGRKNSRNSMGQIR